MTFGPNNTLGAFLPINQTFSENDSIFLQQVTNRDRDIARYINIRDIAIYDLVEVPTGRQFFNPSNTQIKRDGFRKVFTFAAAGAFAHNISGLTLVTAYGEFTDNTNFYGAIYGSNVAIAGQVSFYVTPNNIVVLSGAGAPAITNGVIILEYLKN